MFHHSQSLTGKFKSFRSRFRLDPALEGTCPEEVIPSPERSCLTGSRGRDCFDESKERVGKRKYIFEDRKIYKRGRCVSKFRFGAKRSSAGVIGVPSS